MIKKIMKQSLSILVVLALGLSGCQDLATQNFNNPDEERALAQPTDVENLIAASYYTWFIGLFNGYPMESHSTMADYLSYSWGNFGVQDLSSEPRKGIDNTTSWNYRAFVETPWFRLYSAISSTNDGLKALNDGLEIEEAVRARAFAKFVQGSSHAMLAVLYDQAFIFDETVDLETTTLELSPSQDVFAAGKAQLEEAISLMDANSFTLEESWIPGNTFTNVELAQLARTLLAKFMVMQARTPAERALVDWNTVMNLLSNGITSDFVMQDTETEWWHSNQWYHFNVNTTWGRVDYKLIGSSDRSSGYQDWLNTPVADRDDFEMDTADLRIWDQTRDADGKQNDGLYIHNNGDSRHPASRGTYHHSQYMAIRWPDYRDNNGSGAMYIILAKELDFLRAEALLHTGGDLQEVVDIINSTRVTNGGLPPAELTDGPGTIADERDALKPASLWAMLKYEKGIETFGTFVSNGFTDRRGWGELVSGTPIHSPIPAAEMEVLQLQVYTFGGVGGDGAAPKRSSEKVGTQVH